MGRSVADLKACNFKTLHQTYNSLLLAKLLTRTLYSEILADVYDMCQPALMMMVPHRAVIVGYYSCGD